MYPEGTAGRMVATVAMISGVLVLALPLSVIGSNFSNSYDESMKAKAYQARLQPSQPANQPTSQPANQPTSQPTSQPANPPTSQPANQPTNQHPTSQPANQPAN